MAKDIGRSLDGFLSACRHNLHAPLDSIPTFVREFDNSIDTLCSGLSNPRHLGPAQLMLQSFGSTRSALLLIVAGASNASHAVLRQAIEASAHAYLLRFDQEFRDAWEAEYPTARQRNELRAWRTRLKAQLEVKDRKLWDTFDGNYRDWIELGAHPTPMSLAAAVRYEADSSSSFEMSISILSDGSDRNFGYFGIGNASLIFMDFFEYIWPDRASLMGLTDMRRLGSVYFGNWLQRFSEDRPFDDADHC